MARKAMAGRLRLGHGDFVIDEEGNSTTDEQLLRRREVAGSIVVGREPGERQSMAEWRSALRRLPRARGAARVRAPR